MGSLMGLIGSVIVVIAALAQCTAAETTYIVGDSAGWTLPFNTSWASGKTFNVGDKLSFTFDNRSHDVAQVTPTDYDSCTNTSNSNVSTTSPTIITLGLSTNGVITVGEHYFICTFPTHCARGQKLSVEVVYNTTRSSPSFAPSRAAAFGVAGAFMAVLTALFL